MYFPLTVSRIKIKINFDPLLIQSMPVVKIIFCIEPGKIFILHAPVEY